MKDEWKVGAKVSAPNRWSGGWTPFCTVTKVTNAGNVALDGGPVEYRISRDGECITRRGRNVWDSEVYFLMTPAKLAQREADNAEAAHKRRAMSTAGKLADRARRAPNTIPTDLLDAIDALPETDT